MKIFTHWACNGALFQSNANVGVPVNKGAIDGVECVRTFWKPSVEELANLQAGGSVMLTIEAKEQPATRIDVLPA